MKHGVMAAAVFQIKPFYLEVKLEVNSTEVFVIILYCTEENYMCTTTVNEVGPELEYNYILSTQVLKYSFEVLYLSPY